MALTDRGAPVSPSSAPGQPAGNVVDRADAGGGYRLAIGDVLRIISENRRIILAACTIGLLLGIVGSMLVTPKYRATALLQYNPQANELFEQGLTMRGPMRLAMANQEAIATQMGLLQSKALARRVAEDLHLADRPEFGGNKGAREDRVKRATAFVQGNISVASIKNSLLINVSFSATDPQLAAQVTNALAQGFITSSLERGYNSSSYARRFLSNQLARTKLALEESESALNAYGIASGVFHTPGQVVNGKSSEAVSLGATDLAAMNEALNAARVQRIAAAQAWRNGSEAQSADGLDAVSALVQQKAGLQAEYAQNSKLFKPDYPQMQQLAARIAQLDAAIAAEHGRSANGRNARLLAAYRSAEQIEAKLAAQVEASKQQLQTERRSSIKYNILQREVDTNRALYDALLQRYKEVGVAGGIGQSNIALIDDAAVPTAPYSPRFMLNAVIGLLFGLVTGVGIAFVISILFDSIVNANDVRQKLNLPVLGVIPMEPDGRPLMEALADHKSAVSEAYYSAMTGVKFAWSGRWPRSLFVTSTRPAEGKSTSAYAIASSAARLGSKVLLIDADLRKPTFTAGRSDGLGFAHLLTADEPIMNYVQPTQMDNLSLLPVGRYEASAAELLSTVRLPGIIAEANEHFDLIVLDGPPVLGLTDAPLLGSVAEATVVVIESRQSRTSNSTDMVRRLYDSGSQVIGVILTKVLRGASGYGYDYSYYSYAAGAADRDETGRIKHSRALDLGRRDA